MLAIDDPSVLVFPSPDPLEERVAADVVPRLAFFLREVALDHHLRGDAGMIGAGQPQRSSATHAMPANERVLDRGRERVTHVQAPRDVRWRQHAGEMGTVAGSGGKQTAVTPTRVPARLDFRRLVDLGDFRPGGP